jgi:hypothetical protein
MTRKIITGVIAAILVVTIAVFAAEKAKEKASAEKSCSKAEAGERGEGFERHEGLLDQLAEAYKANDREKMGEIIAKMQERREDMREFAKIRQWHRGAHRNWAMAGPGWGKGQQMAGPGANQGCAMRGQGPNQGCPMAGPRWGQFQAMRGRGFGGGNNMMGNCGPMAGGFGQMPCRQGGMGMGDRMPQQNGPGQMPGWERGFQKNCAPGQDADNMEPRGCNMPRRERMNVPPPEWGW